eukprot:gnl/TRDRNA2_/TRDRNA2_191491_c0_seq1.p1 gnl/TRDRNA2_/TRDRNA2_191491_c0~~gnl/TRDRNA2_/TRDRNA2_191491_c0_seq1.p1  ORF type:complete len:288 (+),score=41.97 gnl/TRDRNA2_/TRDRNA2_191491_c0_seq1:50-913(+)
MELRPHCAACCQPLKSDMVASRCNHVFHRACAPAVDSPCPKCGLADAGNGALPIYGVVFGRSGGPVKQGVGELNEVAAGAGISEDVTRDAMETAKLRHEIGERDSLLKELRVRVDEARVVMEAQQKRQADADRLASRRTDERDARGNKLSQLYSQHEQLVQQVQQGRERHAVLEYRDILASKPPADALAFFTRIVSMVSDPAPLLTEVARLRDHHRREVTQKQREGTGAASREQRIRREIEERERQIAKIRRRLQRCAGAGSEENLRPQDQGSGLAQSPLKKSRIAL